MSCWTSTSTILLQRLAANWKKMKMSNEIIMGVNFRRGKAKEGISSLCTAEHSFLIFLTLLH